MPFSALALLALLTTAHSAHLPLARIPRRVDQSINPRAEYLGGWAWSTSDVCSGAWSESCGTSNNSCCPTGETCFKTGYGPYCCPTDADCINKLLTLPACADQSMEMYLWPYHPYYFCCLPGLTAIVPHTGDGGLCLPADQNVPASKILTASEQVGVGLVRTSAPVVSATSPPAPGRITNYTPSTPTSSSTSCTTSLCPSEHDASADNLFSSNSKDGLSTPAIGGIAAAAVVFALIIAFRFVKWWRKRTRMNVLSRVKELPSITPRSAKPMYVSTGQPYFTPQPAPVTDISSVPAPHEPTNTQGTVPASAMPVSPLSPRVESPPPAYGSPPAAQFGELHGQAIGPGELDGGREQERRRMDGRENITGRHEM